ncbi:MAG: hypothetical protein SGILL_007179 [Bacillariaceae sp.]
MSVLDYIRAKLDGELELPYIDPHAKGFLGTIERNEKGYTSYGRAKALDKKTVLIDELPIGVWTNNYKAHLLKMQSKGIILDFKEDHTTTKVSFKVRMKPGQLSRMKQAGLEKSFRLRSNLQTTNMNSFDKDGKIQKYASPEDIADAYYPTRLSLYCDRKSVLMSEMKYTSAMVQNKARFIQMVADGQIDLIGSRMSGDETNALLRRNDFKTMEDLNVLRRDNSLHRSDASDLDSEADESHSIIEEDLSTMSKPFDYLLKMPLSSLTSERISTLTNESTKQEAELKKILNTEPEEIWMTELDQLARHL